MCRSTKRGFQTLEAALFLPVFLIAVLTIAYLIKVAAVEENILHTMTDEARKLSMYAYNVKVAPGFRTSLSERILEENNLLEELEVDRFLYLYPGFRKDDLITIQVSGKVKNILPILLFDDYSFSERITFRGFTGRNRVPDPVDFTEMEKVEESIQVWVFPLAGERYHEKNCSYIDVAARQVLLTKEIRRRFSPCSLCQPDEADNGNVVYCFEKAGRAYHLAECHQVERYVISLEKKDAERKGYLPCSKCMP